MTVPGFSSLRLEKSSQNLLPTISLAESSDGCLTHLLIKSSVLVALSGSCHCALAPVAKEGEACGVTVWPYAVSSKPHQPTWTRAKGQQRAVYHSGTQPASSRVVGHGLAVVGLVCPRKAR